MSCSCSRPSLARSRRTWTSTGAGAAEEVIAPQLLQQLRAGEHLPGVLCEVLQQLELLVVNSSGRPRTRAVLVASSITSSPSTRELPRPAADSVARRATSSRSRASTSAGPAVGSRISSQPQSADSATSPPSLITTTTGTSNPVDPSNRHKLREPGKSQRASTNTASYRAGHPTPLGQAFAEYGRIDKTMHLLSLVDPVDDTYRRRMNRQLTVQESRHRLARVICHGKRGQIQQAYRDGQEDQLGCLGLVLNAAALWATRYLDAAVAQLRAQGHPVRDEDAARLSPLKATHLNVLGRYSITASQPGQGLRPLRDPARADDEDE
jgi:hypothetical protein